MTIARNVVHGHRVEGRHREERGLGERAGVSHQGQAVEAAVGDIYGGGGGGPV